MSPRRNTLGNRLAKWVAATTAVCLIAFTGIAASIWWMIENDDDEPGEAPETPRDELIEQLLLALGIAAPLGIASTMLAARWLTRRATARIDAVVATAARVSARDLTARLPVSDAGDEVDDLSLALNRMLVRIDAGIAGQRQFAADASHELRTPLTAVRSVLEVARRRPRSSEEWEHTADQALGELVRMSALIDALLQLARADAGAGHRDPIAIGDVIDRVCDTLASKAAVRGIELQAAAAPDLLVTADPAGIEIALANLVANALAHSPDRGVIAILGARVDASVRIDVSDQGPGVPAEDRQQIFAPFARARVVEADRVAGGAGVGLGLAIARRITEAHGGRIEVSDAPGGGARFSLWLPAGPDP
jgi:signal transduction histidine kinase